MTTPVGGISWWAVQLIDMNIGWQVNASVGLEKGLALNLPTPLIFNADLSILAIYLLDVGAPLNAEAPLDLRATMRLDTPQGMSLEMPVVLHNPNSIDTPQVLALTMPPALLLRRPLAAPRALTVTAGLTITKIMIPAYDNSAMSAVQGTTSRFTWLHTATAGAYGLIALFCSTGWGGEPISAGVPIVKFGALTLPSLGYQTCDNNPSNGWVWVFGANNMPGGEQTMQVTPAGDAGAAFKGWAASFTYKNVGSVGVLQKASGNSSLGAVSVPSAAHNMVWGAVTSNGMTDGFGGFTLTQRQSGVDWAYINDPFVAGDKAAAGAVTVSATVGPPDAWAAVGLNLVHA